MKNKDFIDWFAENFGYGYGTGEPYIIHCLKLFLENCPKEGNYDYRVLENVVGKPQTWLLMNTLCKTDILEYGTSPRFGWLDERGKLLKEFLSEKTEEELYELVANTPDGYIYCGSDYCNCSDKGYVEGKKCDNPLFH